MCPTAQKHQESPVHPHLPQVITLTSTFPPWSWAPLQPIFLLVCLNEHTLPNEKTTTARRGSHQPQVSEGGAPDQGRKCCMGGRRFPSPRTRQELPPRPLQRPPAAASEQGCAVPDSFVPGTKRTSQIPATIKHSVIRDNELEGQP